MVDYLKECMKEPVPREWSFPESEYRARLEKTRKAMDDAGIDVLLVHAIVDNCYLSGYQSLWPEAYACLIVPRDGEPFMQVGEIEGALAVLQGYVKDIVTFSWVGRTLRRRNWHSYSPIGALGIEILGCSWAVSRWGCAGRWMLGHICG